jgi:hypothetical protein
MVLLIFSEEANICLVASCGGMDSPLHVEVRDDDDNGKSDYIGSFQTTLRELSLYRPNPLFFLINKAKETEYV